LKIGKTFQYESDEKVAAFYFGFLPVLVTYAQSISDKVAALPPLPESHPVFTDWLLNASEFKSGIYRGAGKQDLLITNGLIERSFRLSPNLACYSFRNLLTEQEMLRAIKPEALATLNGK